jgi:hypothetical protein
MAEHIMAYGPCFCCGVPFWFDPDSVPSLFVDPVTGKAPDMGGNPERAVREPVCIPCRELANPVRITAGLEPWPFPERDQGATP